MKRFWLGAAAAATLAACGGGNPFVADTTGGGTSSAGATVPAVLLNDLDSFTYDPATQTLTVRGVNLDNSPYEAVYTRKPALDVPGYEAYTSQESSLGRHTTAY
ncbi:MAG: thymidylate synthase, partial [Alphaproteobacteria bacterium]